MSTIITDNWLDHWDYGDQCIGTVIESSETKYSSQLIKWPTSQTDISDTWSDEEEIINNGDCEKDDEIGTCSTTNNKINTNFDAPYVSRLYQLCYDIGNEGENNFNFINEDLQINKDENDEKEKVALENEANTHRNNREEIRRKLAMGSDTDDYYGGERGSRKSSLQSRLQVWQSPSGMNLQICFMNETANDSDSVAGVNQDNTSATQQNCRDPNSAVNSDSHTGNQPSVGIDTTCTPNTEQESTNFISKQARLQAEARVALAQAKQMARMQMEVEKQRKKKSPIAEIVGIPFPDGKYKLSRHALSEMNLAHLQVIVNDLHTQIENLNEDLVRLLLERDDLHMEQDSMLVDIEDLTRYL